MSTLASVAEQMNQRGFQTTVVKNKEEALKKLISLIPEKSEVMTGSSTTLNEIGFTEFLDTGKHSWKNLQKIVWSENDEKKRNKLRRQAIAAEYFVASVNAVSEDGQLVAVDATGSRVSAYPFAAEHLLFVVGKQKISANLEKALERVRTEVFPQENERAQAAYGAGSTFGKWVIIEREVMPNRIHVILVDEDLGF